VLSRGVVWANAWHIEEVFERYQGTQVQQGMTDGLHAGSDFGNHKLKAQCKQDCALYASQRQSYLIFMMLQQLCCHSVAAT
jgi:hypothetical protein